MEFAEALKEMNIAELVENHLGLVKQRDEITFKEKEPLAEAAFTIPEYRDFVKRNNQYKENRAAYDFKVLDLDNSLKTITNHVRAFLPSSNVWFLNEERTHAIAIKYTNWGGGTWELCSRTNEDPAELIKDLPKLIS